MITKQSNNILPELHPLVTWHYGENYVFDACMRFLMERVKATEPILADFDFFGGVSGDTIIQVYGHGFERSYNCHDIPLSSVWDGVDFVGYVFNEIGYEHTYVPASQIKENKMMYTETVKAYIDKGIPVLARTVVPFGHGSNYELIVGYEENGNVLLYLDGDDSNPHKVTVGERIGDVWNVEWDWIFIGDKKHEVDKKQLYKNCLKHVLDIMTISDKYGCSYGAKAFRDWADDIENGWFADSHEYTTYVCLLATNGRACTTLDRIYECIPEFTFIKELLEQFRPCLELWNDLEKLGGGFNVTNEIMKNINERKKIADKVREFAVHMDEVIRNLKENDVVFK